MRISAEQLDVLEDGEALGSMTPLPMRVTAKENFAENQDVIILVDGSASINRGDFQKMKQLSGALAQRFTGQATQLGLVQVGDSAREEQCLTTDRSLFDSKTLAMVQMRGGTDILAGLQLCAQGFSHSSLPNNGKQLWILTDGVYTGGDPTHFARELQRQGVLITAIGIGYGITQDTLQNVASYGRAFWKEDFDKAVEFISSGITPNLRQELTHLQVFLENSMNKIGYDVSFLLEITNNVEQSIPSQSCVYIPQTQYFNARRIILPREIHPYQKWQTPFVLECKNSNIRNQFHDWILKLPQIIEIYLCDSTGNWIPTNENGFELLIDKFAGDVIEWRSSDERTPDANILLFGPQGSGKSSFVNSVFTALSENVQELSIAGGGSSRITTRLERFPTAIALGDYDAGSAKINFFDCPGIEENDATYQGEEIEMIVEGVMKVGEKIVNEKLLYSDLRRRKRLNDKDTAWKQRIHSVIFVIPQQYAADSEQQQDLIQPYVAMYEKLRNELKRKAIVAVSQFDKVGQENGRLVLQQIADSFNIPVDQVYPLINYSSGIAKNTKLFEMDQRTIHILYAALQGASNFMRVEALGQVERLFDYDDDDLSHQFQQQVNLGSSSSSQGTTSNVASTTELMEEIWEFMMDLVNEDLLEPEDFEALKNANEGKLRSIYKSAMKAVSEDDKIYRFLRGAKQFQLL